MRSDPTRSDPAGALRARSASLLTLSLWTAALAAQEPAVVPGAIPDTALLLQRPPQIADGGTAGGLWGNGGDYKVSLHDGFVFYPYVGAALPHQPLRWTTRSVAVGGQELVDPAIVPAPKWSRTRCEYDLGAVLECYDLRPDGVEQTFVLEGGPYTGDLVVRGAIDTPLRLASRGFAHGDLALTLGDGTEIIGYGAATAVDAAGRRFPMQTAVDGHEVLLRLDAAVVAKASWPLVVDPVVSNLSVLSTPRVVDVDVLHEALTPLGSQARTWVAYHIEVAAGDGDVWVTRFSPDFAAGGTDAYREISAWDASHPRLALCEATSEVLTVLASGPNGGAAQRFVLVHPHLTSDLALRTGTATPFNNGVDHDWRPEIGSRTDGSAEVMITWQREVATTFVNTDTSSIQAGVWDAATRTVVTPAFVLRNRPNRDQERPSVNRAAAGDEWVVVYQEHDGTLANDDWDVEMLAVDRAGSVTPTGLQLDEAADPLLHTIVPRIGGSGGRYVVRYTVRPFDLLAPKPTGRAGDLVRVQRLDVVHPAGASRLPWPAVTLAQSAGDDLLGAGVGFDDRSDSHWGTAVADVAAGSYRLFKLGYRGMVVESLAGLMPPGFEPQPGGVAFNGTQREFVFGYGGNDGSAGGNSLFGAIVGYEPVTPAFAFGLGCGSGVQGGLAAMVDKQQLGAEDFTFALQNAPEDGLALFLLSVDDVSFPLGGVGMIGCTLLADSRPGALVYLVAEPVNGGAARHRIAIPEDLPPFRLVAQWGYPATGANPAGIQASDAVDVAIGR
ncbi:MAG: hypothetical protein AB7O97_07060 [Planctomycetota bacterium]